MSTHRPDLIRERVRQTYAEAAVAGGEAKPGAHALAESIYGEGLDTDAQAAAASLGCGNPTALIHLRPGQTVLDLGSGGGLDVLMTARRVGSTGRVIGVDMTAEMLALAEKNRAAAGLENVEFRLGHIEDLPLDDEAVDVVISNCVVNLSADKAGVLAEAYRVLRPGGQLAIADLATRGPVPPTVADSLAAWAGCLAGAIPMEQWESLLAAVGFTDALVRVVRTYGRDDVALLAATPLGSGALRDIPEADLAAADGQLVSVHVTAGRPALAAEAGSSRT